MAMNDNQMPVLSNACSPNASQEWKLTTPLCSTKFNSLAALVSVASFLSLITLFNILGNVFVLVALCRYGTLRTMSNCLIGNLAISDLLLAITVLPISISHDVLGYWPFGELICTTWLCADVLYCTASIWGLNMIAFDRYMATLYPVWYHDKRSVKKAMGCILFVWIFSVVVSLAPLIGWQNIIPNVYTYNSVINRNECILFTSSSYVIYSTTGSFVLPACFMAFMYIRIASALHKQSKGIKRKISRCVPNAANNGVTKTHTKNSKERTGKELTDTTPVSITGDAMPYVVNELSVTYDNIGQESVINESPSFRDSLDPLEDFHDSLLSVPSAHGDDLLTPNERTSVSLRSNSVAFPCEPCPTVNGPEKKSPDFLDVIELDRRHSHSVTMPRSTSEVGCIIRQSASTNDVKLDYQTKRSRSVNMILPGNIGRNPRKDLGRLQPKPKPSLPLEASKLTRNHRMTMSMKRRFELREQQATKRMLLVMTCFGVCWTPFFIMYIVRSTCFSCPMNKHFVTAIIWLGYANSSLNPVLYTLFNDDFRTAFRDLIGGRWIGRTRRKRRVTR